jgi:voltage-gated potassium channel
MHSIKYENYSLIILLISLLFVLLIYPFIKIMPDTSIILEACLSFVLVAAVIATTHNIAHLIIAFILALGAFATNWGTLFNNTQMWLTVNLSFNIVFLGYVIWIHIIKIMTTRSVTSNLLCGSLCVYLLIGLMMAFAYMLIDLYIPDSFTNIATDSISSIGAKTHYFFQYTYYSFVTLTTLGYGDIHPASQPAEALAYMEAVTGQFYLTVLVARLIGLHVSGKKKI